MRRRQALIAVLTFLAGLYFILDYVVPPSVPVHRGVVASVTAATVTLGNGTVYLMDGNPQVVVQKRNVTGEMQETTPLLRKVRTGDRVTVRRDPLPYTPSVGLLPGESFYSPGKDQPVVNPAVGATVTMEARDTTVRSIDYGRVTLISDTRQEVHLGKNDVILRLSRFDPPAEVQPPDLQVGDTVKIGPGTGFADYRDTAAQFNLVVSTFAFGMGLLSLGAMHARTLRKRSSGWYSSVFFFVAVVIGLFAGQYKYSDPGTSERAFSDLVVLKVLAAVGSTVFSLLAFYMASAAYRAFRVRTVEAGLMMASALVVMLGQTPFGTYLTSWMGENLRALWLPNVAGWILRVPTTAIFRGLIFGIMMGAIATALRYWLSAERSAAMRD